MLNALICNNNESPANFELKQNSDHEKLGQCQQEDFTAAHVRNLSEQKIKSFKMQMISSEV